MNYIKARNLSKSFNIGTTPHGSRLNQLFYMISGRELKQKFWALKDISFEIHPGEFIGIIGRNGAGKSTLLSALAGILTPDEGTLETQGHIVSILGLNFGLKDRLSMRDNIFLCCALFGLSTKTIKASINAITQFAGLEKFLDTKIYQFSTGMIARLVYSMAIHCNPRILLLDEVTLNTDIEFNQRIIKKSYDLSDNGVIFIVVSHDMDVIRRCHKILWLDQGQIKMQGDTEKVLKEYLKHE